MKAVLWDLDGTLADSSEFHWRAWQETMSASGVPITHEQFLESFGQRNDAILTKWLGTGTAPSKIQKIGDAKEARYRDLIEQEGIAPLPGAAEWVRRLHEAGWKQAIASSAPRLNVDVMARVLGLRTFVEAIVSAEDVHRGKPDPEVFLSAAAKLGVTPDRSIVVEDAEPGIEAARRAGMRCVGVGAAANAPADLCVSSLADLADDAFDRLLK